MGAPSFCSMFAQDFAVREAIHALISDESGPVDPVAWSVGCANGTRRWTSPPQNCCEPSSKLREMRDSR
jgi:hypothetical protein